MQTVPMPSAASSSLNDTHTIQVYDSDGIRISFSCVKDPNDHFRFIPLSTQMFRVLEPLT